MIAMRYGIGGDIRVCTCSPYEKYEQGIRIREDTRQITGEGDLLGQDDELEWGCVYSNRNPGTDYLLSVPSGRGWLQEDCEIDQPERAGHDCLSSRAASENFETKEVNCLSRKDDM